MPMHPYVIVLAATPQEASEYIRRAGIPRGRSRAAASASAIRGLRQATVHALPSFKSRRDKFAILAELRWAKVTEWVDVEMPPKRLTLAEALEEAFPAHPHAETIELMRERQAILADMAELADTEEMTAATNELIEHLEHGIAALEADVNGDVEAPPSSNEDIPEMSSNEDQLEAEQPIEELGIAPGDIVDVEQADAALKNRRRTRCKDCGALHFKDEPCQAPKDAPATPAADFFS